MIDRSELHALADNELSESERQDLLRRMSDDASAQAELQSIQSMKSMLRCQEGPELDTAELWKRCQDRLTEIDKTKRVEGFVGKYAWGICGLFFLAIAMAGFFNRASGRSVRPDEVAGYVAGMSPISVPRNADQTQLEPALKEVVGEAFRNRPAKWLVTAIGRNATPGHRCSYVQLTDEFGDVAVVAMHDVAQVDGLWQYEPDPEFGATKFDGVNALFWKRREDGEICMVVGQRSYDELYSVVQSICPTQGP